MSTPELDVLVVGSGVAGLSAAVRLATAGKARVGVLTKGALEQSATRWAQGGVAAVLPGDEDSTDLHLADTLRAGAGLCDEAAVRVLVDEGPKRVAELIALGAVFDRAPSGKFARAREGGHSMARVLHAGGTATGAEVERALVEAVKESAAAVLEHSFAIDLLVERGACRGVLASVASGPPERVEARDVILASGGAGQLYAVTTNPTEATGDGVAMALRAGVPVADIEFVQFHPTALHHPGMPRPLISEALRGHGAVLRDIRGRRFVGELEPRDVVSAAIAKSLAETGSEHVWLDCTGLEDFSRRFPTIYAALLQAGLNPVSEWVPVAPAAHYVCGGILTNLDGATALEGLWAAGEVACSGVHGANRLASNSLLEGMVFGARTVEAITAGSERPARSGASAQGASVALRSVASRARPRPARGAREATSPPRREDLQKVMTKDAGLVRDGDTLAAAAAALDRMRAGLETEALSTTEREPAEVRNLLEVATALVASATQRLESRGAHRRSDAPHTSEKFCCRFVHGGE